MIGLREKEPLGLNAERKAFKLSSSRGAQRQSEGGKAGRAGRERGQDALRKQQAGWDPFTGPRGKSHHKVRFPRNGTMQPSELMEPLTVGSGQPSGQVSYARIWMKVPSNFPPECPEPSGCCEGAMVERLGMAASSSSSAPRAKLCRAQIGAVGAPSFLANVEKWLLADPPSSAEVMGIAHLCARETEVYGGGEGREEVMRKQWGTRVERNQNEGLQGRTLALHMESLCALLRRNRDHRETHLGTHTGQPMQCRRESVGLRVGNTGTWVHDAH